MKYTISVFILVMSPIVCYTQDWMVVNRNTRQQNEIYLPSIKRTDNTVELWVKMSYVDEAAKEYYVNKLVREINTAGGGVDKSLWDTWEYELTYFTISCPDNTITPSSAIQYGTDGKVLFRFDFKEKDLQVYPIPPDSIMSLLKDILCRRYLFEVNKKIYGVYVEGLDRFIKLNPNAKVIDGRN